MEQGQVETDVAGCKALFPLEEPKESVEVLYVIHDSLVEIVVTGEEIEDVEGAVIEDTFFPGDGDNAVFTQGAEVLRGDPEDFYDLPGVEH